MPKHSKPRAGSLQFWPRKRARRIYPRIGSVKADTKTTQPLAFPVWKTGMCHVQYKDKKGNSINKASTVMESSPVFVCGLRFYKQNNSSSLRVIGEKWFEKLPKNLERKIHKNQNTEDVKKEYDEIRLIACTQPEKSGMHKKKPDLLEIPLSGKKEEQIKYGESVIGKEITINEIFQEGEYLDVSGVTKGHGFTGPVKRFGIHLQGRKNEQHHRHVGSIGSVVPRKVDWRVPAAGQHGFHNRTEYSKRLLKIGEKDFGEMRGYGIVKNYVLVEGSVPGPRKRLIVLTKTRRPKATAGVELVSEVKKL
jgi:large subunit ribosomal protein L3